MSEPASTASTPEEEHPLQKSWSLWFKGGKLVPGAKAAADDWDCGTLAFTFNSVEGFWRMFNNITAASKLPDKADVYIFADGIKPKFEDPSNVGGGEWRIGVPRGRGAAELAGRKQVENYWLKTVLGCIGEVLDESGDIISGVAVNIRKREDRVAIWTRTSDPAKVMEVGKRLRALLGVSDKVAIKFQTYAEGKPIMDA